MEDIKTKADITLLVNSFYQEIQKDKLIGPIFSQRIKPEQWPSHLDKMISFWTTVLFHVKAYNGNPFSHHIHLNIDQAHFDRWIKLFNVTVNNNFEGPKAQEAMQRAKKMRLMFEAKLKHIHANPNQHPIL